MNYKAIANPQPYAGRKPGGKREVVPDQSMSLEEILSRFTRGEAVNVGKDVNYHESNDDLEKVSRMDLVDKAEYSEKLRQTQFDFNKQQKAKAAAERKRLAEEVKADLKKEAEKAAKADLKP